MGAGAHRTLQARKQTQKGARNAAALFNILYAFLVEDILQLATKLGPLQRLLEEIAFQLFIVERLADFPESFLVVNERFNHRAQHAFGFNQIFRRMSHSVLPSPMDSILRRRNPAPEVKS